MSAAMATEARPTSETLARELDELGRAIDDG